MSEMRLTKGGEGEHEGSLSSRHSRRQCWIASLEVARARPTWCCTPKMQMASPDGNKTDLNSIPLIVPPWLRSHSSKGGGQAVPEVPPTVPGPSPGGKLSPPPLLIPQVLMAEPPAAADTVGSMCREVFKVRSKARRRAEQLPLGGSECGNELTV